MVSTFIQWFIDLIRQFASFGTWLTTDLKLLGFAPLEVFSFAGLTFIIGFLVYRLIIGG